MNIARWMWIVALASVATLAMSCGENEGTLVTHETKRLVGDTDPRVTAEVDAVMARVGSDPALRAALTGLWTLAYEIHDRTAQKGDPTDDCVSALAIAGHAGDAVTANSGSSPPLLSSTVSSSCNHAITWYNTSTGRTFLLRVAANNSAFGFDPPCDVDNSNPSCTAGSWSNLSIVAEASDAVTAIADDEVLCCEAWEENCGSTTVRRWEMWYTKTNGDEFLYKWRDYLPPNCEPED